MFDKLNHQPWSTKLWLLGAVLLSFYNFYLGMLGMPSTLNAFTAVIVTHVIGFMVAAAIPAWIVSKLVGNKSSKSFFDIFTFIWYSFLALFSMGTTYNYVVQTTSNWFVNFLLFSVIASLVVIVKPRQKDTVKG